MQLVTPLFKREFAAYFRSPVAYVFIVVFLVSTTILTFFPGQFFESNEASLRILFQFFPWIFLLMAPAICMRLWAEEKRSGTWELLFTLPITTSDAVIGKFLAAWAFFTTAILLTFPMVLTVAYLGTPDWGPVVTGYAGAVLMGGSYLAICAMVSALTRNQVVAFVGSFLVCLVLLFIGVGLVSDLMGTLLPWWLAEGISQFSFLTRYEALMIGLFPLGDVLYFALVAVFALAVNILVLER